MSCYVFIRYFYKLGSNIVKIFATSGNEIFACYHGVVSSMNLLLCIKDDAPVNDCVHNDQSAVTYFKLKFSI